MPMVLPNVIVEVARSRYESNTGKTDAPQPIARGIYGNMSPLLATDWATLSPDVIPGLRATYMLIVPAGTDIVTGDVLTAINKLDGVTPWEGMGPGPGQRGYGSVTWWVRYYTESAPGFLAYRSLFLERVQAGGPAI